MANKSKGDTKEAIARPRQKQDHQPGRESEMKPQPVYENPARVANERLAGRVAVVTGGDSGIGRAIAVAFANEGADVAIVYLEEDADADKTVALVKERGGDCLAIRCDVAEQSQCVDAITQVHARFGRIDVLINNAAEQHPRDTIAEITEENLVRTFRTNIFSMFFLTAAALPHLRKSDNASIINTSSVTAYRGSPSLLDYSSTKGAIVSFTRSLASQLIHDRIRVNGVAPGPIWTPLTPATFPAEEVATFGSDSPMGHAGQPWEVAGCYVFLASAEASYMTGQMLHPNGGEIING